MTPRRSFFHRLGPGCYAHGPVTLRACSMPHAKGEDGVWGRTGWLITFGDGTEATVRTKAQAKALIEEREAFAWFEGPPAQDWGAMNDEVAEPIPVQRHRKPWR